MGAAKRDMIAMTAAVDAANGAGSPAEVGRIYDAGGARAAAVAEPQSPSSLRINPSIFREYDIRGVAGADLSPEFAARLGDSFRNYLEHGGIKPNNGGRFKVAVGSDSRLSGASYRRALVSALRKDGVDVVEIGPKLGSRYMMTTTPATYFAAKTQKDLDAVIMITASHNPAEYNGFKISVGQKTIYGEEVQKILHEMQDETPRPPASVPGQLSNLDIHELYSDFIYRDLTQNGRNPTPLAGLTIVLDSGNGTAGLIAPELFRKLGAKVISLFEEPDGRFPNHHPDPSVEKNVAAAMAAVKQNHADFALLFDGDGDRLGVVDETGRMLSGEQTMTILSREILKTHPGGKIMAEVKTSQRFFDDVARHGGTPIMYKTGASLMKPKMEREGIVLGGEMSGHIVFNDERWLAFDDGTYAGARFAEVVARNKRDTVSSLLKGLPDAFSTPEISIDVDDAAKFRLVAEVNKILAADGYSINEIDGIRINFGDGWGLLRASNTQPMLTTRYEGPTERRAREIQNIFLAALEKAKRNLASP